jgi:phosphate starvation-inducible membrane PsiE
LPEIIKKITTLLKSILVLLVLTGGLLFPLLLGQVFYKLIQLLFWKNSEVICIAPAKYYFRIGTILVFTFVMGCWGIFSLIF